MEQLGYPTTVESMRNRFKKYTIFRGQGVGRKLLQAAENYVKGMDARGMGLNSGNRSERMTAQKFSKKMGYEEKSIGFAKRLQ